MSADTSIEWCDHTWNPWEGCTRVSPACDFCYAAARAAHYQTVQWDGPPRRCSSTWKGPPKWNDNAAASHRRARVFCLSLGDFFDNQAQESWRSDAWRVIDSCRSLDRLILTKRPQNIAKMLPTGWPWPHVWLGVTAENQEEANRRIPLLLNIPASIHFISAEPLFEPINLSPWLGPGRGDWVITGGESDDRGRHRPFDPDWARRLLSQCRVAGSAFFMKQLGSGWPHHGTNPELFPADLRVREWPDMKWLTNEPRGPSRSDSLFDDPPERWNARRGVPILMRSISSPFVQFSK
jgi:protein gp37